MEGGAQMKKLFVFVIITGLLFVGCTDTKKHAKGIYMLIDTSGTYSMELKKAQSIVNYLLGTLQPGDTLAVARIDTGSFSEKDIVAKVMFDARPSVANSQKRVFKKKIDKFISSVKSSSYTDISGGILQAIEYLNEVDPGTKYILIFSDLKEELAKGYVRDVPFELAGFNVIALNVTKLRSDNLDPKEYLGRVGKWRVDVEKGSGNWRVINDLERLDNIFSN